MFLICSAIVVIVILGLHYRTRYSRFGKLIDEFSGPEPLPIIGNALNLRKYEDHLSMLIDMNKQYFPTWRVWLFDQATVGLQSPDDIKKLLSSSKHINKGFFYKFFKDWLNDNLFLSIGKKWQHRRRLILPLLNSNKLDKYCRVSVKYGAKLVEALKIEKKEIVLERFLATFVLNTVYEFTLGSPIEPLDDKKIEEYVEAVYRYCEILVYRPWFYFNWTFYNFSGKARKQREVIRILHNFLSSTVRERKELHMKTKDFSSTNNVGDGGTDIFPETVRKETAIIDQFLAALNDGLIDEPGIKEEMDGAIFAGYETVITSLIFAVQLLAEHTDIQTKARNEVNQMFESCNGKVTIVELNQLYYLHRFLQESMRLYPAVPLIARQLQEDLHLGNRIVPSGCTVVVSIYDLHRDTRLWPEPNKFDPDRFLPERSLDRHLYSYLPFSAGPRNCLGKKAGMLELKVFCAFMLHNFHLEAMESLKDFTWKPNVTLKPCKEIRVKFIPINEPHTN